MNKTKFDYQYELSCLLADREKEYKIWDEQNNWVAENITQSIDLEMGLIRKLIDKLVTKNDLENILEYCQNDLYDIIETMINESIYITEECQCGSCEKFFKTSELINDECPHCRSGNWVFGCIDD